MLAWHQERYGMVTLPVGRSLHGRHALCSSALSSLTPPVSEIFIEGCGLPVVRRGRGPRPPDCRSRSVFAGIKRPATPWCPLARPSAPPVAPLPTVPARRTPTNFPPPLAPRPRSPAATRPPAELATTPDVASAATAASTTGVSTTGTRASVMNRRSRRSSSWRGPPPVLLELLQELRPGAGFSSCRRARPRRSS